MKTRIISALLAVLMLCSLSLVQAEHAAAAVTSVTSSHGTVCSQLVQTGTIGATSSRPLTVAVYMGQGTVPCPGLIAIKNILNYYENSKLRG